MYLVPPEGVTMLQHRPRHVVFSTLWRPLLGWSVVAGLYLTGAVLGVFLATAMAHWWPLLLTIACTLAAAACALVALDRLAP
jgi:zinc transporter ZupT